jgi:uncharacterized protein
MRVRLALVACLALGLVACAESGGRDAGTAGMETAEIRLGSDVITVEVARSSQERAIGLSGRADLAADRGMLFVYDSPRVVAFWMREMLIPIDMVFLRSDVVVDVIADVPPCSADPCPTHGPEVPVDAVLELAAGRAAELGVTPGLRLEISGR